MPPRRLPSIRRTLLSSRFVLLTPRGAAHRFPCRHRTRVEARGGEVLRPTGQGRGGSLGIARTPLPWRQGARPTPRELPRVLRRIRRHLPFVRRQQPQREPARQRQPGGQQPCPRTATAPARAAQRPALSLTASSPL